MQRSTHSAARLQAQARLKPVLRVQLAAAQHAHGPASVAEDPAELSVQRSTVSAARLQAQARLKPVRRLHSSAADGTPRAQHAPGSAPAAEDPGELTVQRSSVSAARLQAQARLKPVRRLQSSAADDPQTAAHAWLVGSSPPYSSCVTFCCSGYSAQGSQSRPGCSAVPTHSSRQHSARHAG